VFTIPFQTHKYCYNDIWANKKPLALREHSVRRKGAIGRLHFLNANEPQGFMRNRAAKKPRKRGIRQRKGVPPLRMRQDAAAYDVHRRRRPEPQSGVAACVEWGESSHKKHESRRSANSKSGFSPFFHDMADGLSCECTRPASKNPPVKSRSANKTVEATTW
jgi:hypothetical protein